MGNHLQRPAMTPTPEKPEHNQVVIGGGLAGISAALELLSHGHEVGEASGADVRVHLYEAMKEEELFDRKALQQRDHYPSSSAFGSRSVRLSGADTLEEATIIARSAKLYQRVHALAQEHKLYDKLAGKFPDLRYEGVIIGQPYITMASTQNQQAFDGIDKQIANIRLKEYEPAKFLGTWRGVRLAQENIPYADILPPVDQLPNSSEPNAPDVQVYTKRLDHYLGELREFCSRYPTHGHQMQERFGLTDWINRPASEWLASGKHTGNTALPRILLERPWTPAYPDRHAISLNINQFLQVSIALMRATYGDRFMFHDGQGVSNVTQDDQGVTITSVDGSGKTQTAQYDQAVYCGGPFMKGTLEQAGVKTEIVAAPYVEFPVRGNDVNAILKGDAIPAKNAVTVDLGDGKKRTFTAKTISRNGAWVENGIRKGDWLKIQFDEKTPLKQTSDINKLPSLQPQAGAIARQFAEGLNIPFTDQMQQASRGRWCPQSYAKHPQTGKDVMFAGPVRGAVTESHDGRINSSTASRIYILGPGMGHGAQLLGGNAHIVAAQMQDRPARLPVRVTPITFPQQEMQPEMNEAQPQPPLPSTDKADALMASWKQRMTERTASHPSQLAK
jgi:hypothetical protein